MVPPKIRKRRSGLHLMLYSAVANTAALATTHVLNLDSVGAGGAGAALDHIRHLLAVPRDRRNCRVPGERELGTVERDEGGAPSACRRAHPQPEAHPDGERAHDASRNDHAAPSTRGWLDR